MGRNSKWVILGAATSALAAGVAGATLFRKSQEKKDREEKAEAANRAKKARVIVVRKPVSKAVSAKVFQAPANKASKLCRIDFDEESVEGEAGDSKSNVVDSEQPEGGSCEEEGLDVQCWLCKEKFSKGRICSVSQYKLFCSEKPPFAGLGI